MSSPVSIRRVPRTTQAARASYDRMSRWYDWLSGSSERRFKEKGLELLDVQAGEKVLEIGFGTGECLQSLSNAAGTAGSLVGVDLSLGMARVASKKLRIGDPPARRSLLCGDARNLPLPNSCFQAIFMSFTLELFDTPEIPLVLAECRRVLCPGGRICVVSLAKEKRWMVSLYERIHDLWPAVVDCRPIYSRHSLEQAGLRVGNVLEMSMFGLPVEIVLAYR